MSVEVINNKADFDAKIKEGKYLVDFFATWCGPCKMLSPVLEEISGELEGENVQIIKVDVDQAPDIASAYGVMSIPAMFVVNNGEQVANESGFKPAADLISWVKSV